MRRLRYTRPALADLEAVLDYYRRPLAAGCPGGCRPASRASLALLTEFPFIGTRTNDPAIRRMTTSPYPYLIFYETTDSRLIVHAVRHAARDPAGMPGAS